MHLNDLNPSDFFQLKFPFHLHHTQIWTKKKKMKILILTTLLANFLLAWTMARSFSTEISFNGQIELGNHSRRTKNSTSSFIAENGDWVELEKLPGAEEQQRIFQGTPTAEVFPFMVALIRFIRGTPIIICGASLISPNQILTAAHCIDALMEEMTRGGRTEAWIGVNDLDNFSGQKMTLRSFMKHPLYTPALFGWNDVGIITLNSAVRVYSQAAPICVGTRNYVNEAVNVIGFGISDCRQPSRKLLMGSGQAYSSAKCRSIGYPTLTLTGQLCVQNREGGGSADRGDSGGPLFTKAKGRFSLVGLVSHGVINETTLCPNVRIPTIYTQAGSYKLFIRLYAPAATFC